MDLSNFKMTEEKVSNLKPVIEKILSRQYGREIKFIELTIGGVTVKSEKERIS
jgi:F0F1-type ATP synthase delta subunit